MSRSITTASGAVISQKQQGFLRFLAEGAVKLIHLHSEIIPYISEYLVPAGASLNFRGGTLPAGFLAEDGSTVSQASYPKLYAAIGSTYNVGGEGAGLFRLPDSRGRADIGAGTYTDPVSGSVTRTLGAKIGAEKHVITLAEMASHNHGGGDHVHSQLYANNPASWPGNGALPVSGAVVGYANATGGSGTIISTQGSGSAHNNMPPSLVVTKMIKF